MWQELHLPLPRLPAKFGTGEARRCLWHLLDWMMPQPEATLHQAILNALEGDAEARAALRPHGIWIDTEAEGFFVANRSPGTNRIFAGTEWQEYGWNTVLRRLDGARRGKIVRIDQGLVSNSVFIPDSWLDTDTAPDDPTNTGRLTVDTP